LTWKPALCAAQTLRPGTTKFISAHDSDLACLALTLDGSDP